jgi:mRNA interferase MazF
MRFEFGDVVLVPFPFTSQTASKKRPAVVVSSRAYNEARLDVVVMALTSQLRISATSDDVWVQNWKAAGFSNRPS